MPPGEPSPGRGERAPRAAQPALVRATHWLNVALLVVMAGSGLQILVAYPFLGARGAPYRWVPLQGHAPPPFLTLGGWLAGARHLHFAFAWAFTANAVLWGAWALATGEWRRRLFLPRRDARDAWRTLLHDAGLRAEPPPERGLYNGMQRLAYTTAMALGLVLVLSGLALYKPVQLPHLTAALGGYDAARALHLGALAGLAAFALVHVVQVLRYRRVADMVTGGRDRPEVRA